MNLIDVTKTHHHYHSDNKVVVVTKRDGIQGPEGKNGISPHIDPETLHWFVGDVDTGVFAGMSNTDDITLIHLFDTKNDFPSVGTAKDLYLDKETSTIYRWDVFKSTYTMFKADYVKNIEDVLVNLQTSVNQIDNTALKKPQTIIPGSLILIDGYGNVSCTNMTYQELLDKIEAKADGDLPTNLTPDSLLIGSSTGGIESSEIQKSELIAVIESSKKALKFVGEKKTNALVLVDESGDVKGSDVTNEELKEAIESSKIAVKYSGDIVPGALVLSTESGIKSSNVTHNELIAAIESTKTAVKFENEVVPDFVVVSGDKGGIKNSSVTHPELLAVIENSKHCVKYDEGEIVPDAVVLSTEKGIKSSDLGYSELKEAIESSKTAVKYSGNIVPGALVLSTESGIESSDIKHDELIAVIESAKKAVKFEGEIIHNSLVLVDEAGTLKSAGKTLDELVEEIQQNAGTQSDWNETDDSSLAFIKNKPDVVEKTDYDALVEVVKKKAGFLTTPIANNLVMADSSGNLYSSTLNVNNIVTADTIVAGSFSDYVIIEEDLVTTVTIPTSVMQYITIDVYHNGKLLVPEIHYLWEAEDYIDLVGFTANKDDIFSFVGHGVTTTMTPFASGGIGGCDHSHMNLEVLDGITQEKVDAWDSATKIFSENGTITSTYLPVATQDTLGAVKSSTGINNVVISDEGIMSVNAIDVSTLVSIDDGVYGDEDYSVVLSSGSSFSYKKQTNY